MSKSEVCRRCGELDELVQALPERPIEGDWSCLCIDPTYVKQREAGRIVSVVVTVAVAANTDGLRQAFGLQGVANEAEPI